MPIWTKWKDIIENPDYTGCGVYKIRLVDSESYPLNIPRFLDTDKEGILQIGRSENIERRIKAFRGAKEGRKYDHAEGKRLNRIMKCPNYEKRKNNCKIEYSFQKLLNKSKAKTEEERLMKCYFKKYGEVPPINNNLPGKDKWENINCD